MGLIYPDCYLCEIILLFYQYVVNYLIRSAGKLILCYLLDLHCISVLEAELGDEALNEIIFNL